MQETECQNIPLPPPPPPRPPLTSIKNTSLPSKLSPDTHFRRVFQDSESALISFYKPLCSILQEGPSCGIAALCMANQFLGSNKTFEQVLDKAKALGFSNQGEMFSVYNMASLAKSILCCKATVVDDLVLSQQEVLDHICCGLPVLVPYDADKNHYPCLNNGTKSHWAVLCGICYSLPECDLRSSGLSFESCEVPLLYRTSNGDNAKSLLHYANKICVYAYHGKSRYVTLWDFKELLASSENLKEVTKKYPMENMVLPMPDPLSELRNKAVLIG